MLGGVAAIEDVAKKAGHDVTVPFTPGRTDASAEQTDAESFAPLEPRIDAFRNYVGETSTYSDEELMVDRSHLLTLSAPEMTVLIGGLRVLGANHGGSDHGVFTDAPGTLTNDFFANLLKTSFTMKWEAEADGVFVAKDRKTGEKKWTGTRVDLVFGSNSQLRALSEAYATDDAKGTFVDAFVAAWTKVMTSTGSTFRRSWKPKWPDLSRLREGPPTDWSGALFFISFVGRPGPHSGRTDRLLRHSGLEAGATIDF